jgi:hypothetical protein
MRKFILSLFLLLLITVTSFLIYISYFGIKTSKFDNLIQNKANEINQNVKLEFQTTKIYLSFKSMSVNVKLQNPKLLIKSNQIKLSKLDLFLSLKSFFTQDFLLKKAEVAFYKNDIKDLTKITSIFLPEIINKQLNKAFKKGNIEGEFIIPFEPDGTIDKDYGFSGKISKADINFTKKLSIKNLTSEVFYFKNNDNGNYKILIENGNVYNVSLAKSEINLNVEEDKTIFDGTIHTKGKLNFSEIKVISSLLGLKNLNFNNVNGSIDLTNKIKFHVNKQFKMQNLIYFIEGRIPYLEVDAKRNLVVNNYLSDYNSKIIFKESNIKINNSNEDILLKVNGLLKLKDNFDTFKVNEIYNTLKKTHQLEGNIDLTNSQIKLSQLNYIKKIGKECNLTFNINFILNQHYNIQNLNFISNKSKINLSKIKLNKNLELVNFKKIEVKTFNDNIKNNDIFVIKEKNINIKGEVFDAEPLLNSLYKKSNKRLFSKEFNSEIAINFDRAISGTGDDISNFAMIAYINKGSYDKLSLKGNFSENEILEVTIYKLDKENKTFQLISDRAKPFLNNFDFIKGFEGGKLEYETIISKKISNSNLLITDFKVSKVPALAKLLTLASLQGIADTLSGEGIRFESFEMKSNTEGNIINIEDALAMGPAISILLDGYVDKGNIVSLRGTLVPATKLNSIIASIPIIGDVLVGKKVGEGVVGVSFKMKGPPKNIKTTVNPIKTLTPRFIVRALEKRKKKKKEKIK